MHHYKMDYDRGSWTIQATYQVGRLGDSMFPFCGKWRPMRRGEKLYLVHASLPAVLRIDEANGMAVPVAIASVAHNRGRAASQFPGSGRDGFPKPWVAAAEQKGFQELGKAPRHYYWGDSDGDGQIDPEEFQFFESPFKPNLISESFVDDAFNYTTPAGGYGGSWYTLPRTGWTGPDRDIPVWAWDRAATGGDVPPEVKKSSAIRGLARDAEGNCYGAVQSGIMIKGHGQFEGGSWPYLALRRSRLAKWNHRGELLFSAGRHSKDPNEYNKGRFYFPQRTVLGPNDTLLVSDQLFQPGTVWTRDGLYAGSMLDQQADDRPKEYYQVHSDDM
ncbi:MAG: hypothetical protein AAF492_33205, partial [Verrucomicrobiota bacterium]